MTSVGEGMTMMLRIAGGRDAKVETPMTLFKKKGGGYLIRGLPNDYPGFCSKTGSEGWISKEKIVEYVGGSRAFPLLPHERKRILYVDNCSSHKILDARKMALESKNNKAAISTYKCYRIIAVRRFICYKKNS